MSINRPPLLCLLAVLAVLGAACTSDAVGSGPSALGDSVPADVSPAVTSAPAATTPTTSSTTVVEALAFQEEQIETMQKVWDDVDSFSFNWTIDFETDPSLDIDGYYTAEQGLIATWADELDGDVLLVIRDGQSSRGFRVGNEVFIGEAEPATGAFFVEELVYPALRALETGILPAEAGTFVTSNDDASTNPDIVYALTPGEVNGTITIAGQSPIFVRADAPAGGYSIPEVGVMLTREQVGNSGNDLLRTWYVNQAG